MGQGRGGAVWGRWRRRSVRAGIRDGTGGGARDWARGGAVCPAAARGCGVFRAGGEPTQNRWSPGQAGQFRASQVSF